MSDPCYDPKRFVAAARFWDEALKTDPKLGDDRQAQHRYNAACVAAEASTGEGKDGPTLDEGARIGLRGRALGWLKAELAAWTKVLDDGPSPIKANVAFTLQHWKVDSDLAGIRDAEALARLPEAERKDWQALWADVEAVLIRVQGPRP